MEQKKKKSIIILVPYPAQGHVSPMKKLASVFVSHGFEALIVLPQHIHRKIRHNNDDDEDEIKWVGLADGQEEETAPDFFAIESAMENCMPKQLEELVERERENDNVVCCLVVDLLASWAIQVAHKFGIPTAGFWPAMFASYLLIAAIPDMLRTGLISDTGVCPSCENEEESDWHIFFACPQAEVIWRQAGLWNTVQRHINVDDLSFKGTIFRVLAAESIMTRNSVAMLIWCIWKRRNEKVWENTVKPARQSIGSTMDFLFQWQHVRVSASPQQLQQSRAASSSAHADAVAWEKPPENVVKCNVDAAIFDDNRFGFGMCIRDSRGSFIMAKSAWHYGCPQPQEAEALGLFAALTWLRELHIPRVTIELDCKPVVDGINGTCNSRTEFGTIITSCKTLLTSLQNYAVSFTRRQANLVAHSLARASRCFASSHTFDCSPNCIASLILNEMI